MERTATLNHRLGPSAPGISARTGARSTARTKTSVADLGINVFIGVSVAFVAYLALGLGGNVVLESARADLVSQQARLDVAKQDVETLSQEVLKLEAPGEVERWAQANSYTSPNSFLSLASSPAAVPLGKPNAAQSSSANGFSVTIVH